MCISQENKQKSCYFIAKIPADDKNTLDYKSHDLFGEFFFYSFELINEKIIIIFRNNAHIVAYRFYSPRIIS